MYCERSVDVISLAVIDLDANFHPDKRWLGGGLVNCWAF